MIRRALLSAALSLPLATVLATAPAAAAERVAQAGTSVRIALDGREVRLRAPSGMPRGGVVEVLCGVGRVSRREPARATRPARPRQRLRLRLSRAVPDAEWCGYRVYVPGDDFGEGEFPSGAGVLQPRIAPGDLAAALLQPSGATPPQVPSAP